MAEILEQHVKMKAKSSSDLRSFSDCPNNCTDGYIFDPYSSTKIICAYCESKRKEMIRGNLLSKDGKSIAEELNLEESLIGISFDASLVIPDFAMKNLKPESVTLVNAEMTNLIEQASLGNLPNYSIIFNFGSKCCENNFIYPYMMRLYRAGVSVCPLMTPLDLCSLRNNAERGYIAENDNEIRYKDLLERDMCIVDIDAGVTQYGVEAVKGLLQLRGAKLKPTIIVTNSWSKYIKIMANEEDTKYYHIPTLVSVEYTEKAIEAENKRKQAFGDSHGLQRSNISSDEFNRMLGRN